MSPIYREKNIYHAYILYKVQICYLYQSLSVFIDLVFFPVGQPSPPPSSTARPTSSPPSCTLEIS